MLRVWVHGCDPGRVSDGSRLALCQTLSIECPSSIFFWHVYFVFCYSCSFLLSFLFVFVFVFVFCRCSSDLFLSNRPRTGLATTYTTGYGRGPIGECEENNNNYYSFYRLECYSLRPVFQKLSYKLPGTLEDCLILSDLLYLKSSKVTQKVFVSNTCSYRRIIHTTLYKGTNRCGYSISRTTPIDTPCCRLPTASLPKNKADKSRCNNF